MTRADGPDGLEELLGQEFLAGNRLGGYACSTIPSLNTRKYHGLLVAAMAPPVRRVVILSRVEELIRARGWPYALACSEYPGTVHPTGHQLLRGFSREPFPRWIYQGGGGGDGGEGGGGGGWTLEKSLQLIRGQNTVVLSYTLLAGSEAVDFELRPLLALRPIHELMYQWNGKLDVEHKTKDRRHHRVPPTNRTPEVFFAHDGAFEPGGTGSGGGGTWYFNTIYRREQERGYAGLEDLWSPGIVRWKLSPGRCVSFICSTDPIDFAKTFAAAEAQCAPAVSTQEIAGERDTVLDTLVRAAEDFSVDLSEESAKKSIGLVTQYPWAAPSVRDALIALPGLLLATGKFDPARALLECLAGYLQGGLIPTRFPEDGTAPLYDGADTSLWVINALWQYIKYSGDESAVARRLLETAWEILSQYRSGAGLGIAIDADGLLGWRAAGIGATWMDAKVGDWVVTPRSGKPVELNALWYNALCAAARLCEHFGQPTRAGELTAQATAMQVSFNRRFWNPGQMCCFDVVGDHGVDPAVRPNQIFAISLPFAVLAIDRHVAVLEKIAAELLTPFGLRTLSRRDPGYHGRYGGNVVQRDRAYHQGTVYPWLLGPWVSANLRVNGRGQKSRAWALEQLQPSIAHMRGAGLGQLCELFDGDAPHAGGGAIASALGVGELLRSYLEDVLDQTPNRLPMSGPDPQLNTAISVKLAAKT